MVLTIIVLPLPFVKPILFGLSTFRLTVSPGHKLVTRLVVKTPAVLSLVLFRLAIYFLKVLVGHGPERTVRGTNALYIIRHEYSLPGYSHDEPSKSSSRRLPQRGYSDTLRLLPSYD